MGRKCDSIDRKDAKEAKFDGEHLICTGNLDWNPHGELLIFIFGWLFILLDQETTTCLQNRSIRSHFGPNFKLPVTLDETQSRIELQIRPEILGEEKLDFHGICSSVIKDDFLSVNFFIYEYVQVVLFFFDVDGNINAGTPNCDRNRPCVVLILEEEGQVLVYGAQFAWNERKLNFGARVTLNLRGTLKGNLSYKLFENVLLGRLVLSHLRSDLI